MHENTCGHCGCVLGEDQFVFEDEVYCEDCLEELTVVCAHCGRRIDRDSNEGNEEIALCSTCYTRFYTNCSRCGRLITEDEAYYESDDDDTPFCYRCHLENSIIHSYYYKPDPIFYGNGSRYFGVELEVDDAGENNLHAKDVADMANTSSELIYCKRDGSLNDGFEIVTHPMTLEYHRSQMPWQEILSRLKEMGYRSHQTRTCGLHCHVNRNSLGETVQEQDEAVARILYLVEKHWEELVKFSRRTQSQLDRWASRYGFHNSPKELLKRAKGGSVGRYACINLQNEDTIEFRIFRGTLKYNSIIAALQLVNRLCDAAVSLCDQDIQELSWTSFVSACTEPELIQYLKERRLYVNDPVESEAEL